MDYNNQVSFTGPAESAGRRDFRESDALDLSQLAAVNLTGTRLPHQDLSL